MRLDQHLLNISVENLQVLQEDLTNAAIMFTSKDKRYRAIFAKGRANNSGGLKKIYAALYHAKSHEVSRMIDVMLAVFSKQYSQRTHNEI